MSNRRDDPLFDTLSETKRLVGDVETPAGGEFSLESILAEFGQGAAKPAPEEASAPPVEEAVAEPAPQSEAEEQTELQETVQSGAEEEKSAAP